MAQVPERRRTTRVQSVLAAQVAGPDGAWIPVRLTDLSVVGLSAEASQTLALGTRCRVEIGSSGALIEACGTVVRAQGRSLALRFDQLPFESFERLRGFLLAHAEDPAVIVDELSERLGFLGESA